jgi:hypothetical protein
MDSLHNLWPPITGQKIMVRSHNYFDQYENLFLGKGNMPTQQLWVVGRILCTHPPRKNRHGLAVESFDVWLEKENKRDTYIELEALAPMEKVGTLLSVKRRMKAINHARCEQFKKAYQMRKLGALPVRFANCPFVLPISNVHDTGPQKVCQAQKGGREAHFESK